MTIETLVAPAGGGLLFGFVAGYALKKIMKIGAIIVGLFILGLAFLQYNKVIIVDWNHATSLATNATQAAYHQMNAAVATAGIHINHVVGIAGGTFIGGLTIGLLKG